MIGGRRFLGKKIDFNGIQFDSKPEVERYKYLLDLESSGEISNLLVHPSFEILPKTECDGIKYRPVNYIADFSYFIKTGEFIVEDVKSDFTRKFPDYILKKKMFVYFFSKKVIFREIVIGNKKRKIKKTSS